MLLEICVENLTDALEAEKAGAHRIELCANLVVGGTTPRHDLIATAAKQLSIPFYPIIRPRGGNFIFDSIELNEMIKAIEYCKSVGCKGVVLGVLNVKNEIDLLAIQKLKMAAGQMHITFHKAFDLIENQKNALEQLISLDIQNVLTSGGGATAAEGQNTLKHLVSLSNDCINILVGGGVRSSNIHDLKTMIGATHFHSRATNRHNEFDKSEVLQMLL